MATATADRVGQKRRDIFEWPFPNVGRFTIANRNVGCLSTIAAMFTYPNPGSFDTQRLTARIQELQQLWPLLSVTIADQRTTQPMIQYHYSTWDTDRILSNLTYEANPEDPVAERQAVYDTAIRKFQSKTAFDHDPLWAVYLFRASSDPENHRIYYIMLIDHVIIDGRGAVRLANALVAKDTSQFPKEDIELYTRVGLGQDNSVAPSYAYIASAMLQGMVSSRLPEFVKRWMGQYPVWPQQISQPTINTPWKFSVLDIPDPILQQIKVAGKKNGVASINPTLHAAWIVTLWNLFLRPDRSQTQAISDCSLKDLRDESKGDPYCLGGHVTVFLWSSGPLRDTSSFWNLAKSYQTVSVDPRAPEKATKMMRMMNLFKNGPVDPEKSNGKARDSQETPVGDKRAHTKFEEATLDKVNSRSPYGGMTGIWCNMSRTDLPEGATDVLMGMSGSAASPAFSTFLYGFGKGLRIYNVFSDGAAMRERDVKRAELLFLETLDRIIADRSRDWVLKDLITSDKPKL